MEFQIKGIEELSNEEREEINSMLASSYEKLKRKTKTDFILKLVVKTHLKSGEKKDKRKHYGIQATISGQTRTFEASADAWDLKKTLHMAMEKLENEIEHSFHVSEQRD